MNGLKVNRAAFLGLIALSSVLPSGEVGGINLKYLLAGLAALTLLITALRGHLTVHQAGTLGVAGLVAVALSVWLLIGTVNGNDFATSQYLNVAVTVLLTAAVVAVFTEPAHIRTALRTVVLGAGLYSAIKLCLTVSVFIRVLSFDQLISLMGWVGTTPVTLEIRPRLLRIQTICDALTPFALYVLILDRTLLRRGRTVMLALLAVSIVLAYARALWLATLVMVLIAVFQSHRLTVRRIIVGTVAAIVLVISTVLVDSSALTARFTSRFNQASDATRAEQIAALWQGTAERPVFGHGMGAYVPGVIRDQSAPYSYEVQWLAFLYQFGAVGTGVLLGLVIAVALTLLAVYRSVAWAAVFLIWPVLSLSNPYLTSSVSAIVCSLCLLGGRLHAARIR